MAHFPFGVKTGITPRLYVGFPLSLAPELRTQFSPPIMEKEKGQTAQVIPTEYVNSPRYAAGVKVTGRFLVWRERERERVLVIFLFGV